MFKWKLIWKANLHNILDGVSPYLMPLTCIYINVIQNIQYTYTIHRYKCWTYKYTQQNGNIHRKCIRVNIKLKIPNWSLSAGRMSTECSAYLQIFLFLTEDNDDCKTFITVVEYIRIHKLHDVWHRNWRIMVYKIQIYNSNLLSI